MPDEIKAQEDHAVSPAYAKSGVPTSQEKSNCRGVCRSRYRGMSRREVIRAGVGTAAGLALAGAIDPVGLLRPEAAEAQAINTADGKKHIYIAADDHTDYMWSGDEATYRQVFLEMTDYYLNQADLTANEPADFQSRWNCDGSFWMWTYEHNKPKADFENRFIARLRSGHLSVPLTTLVGCYGGTPAEGVLRGLYYAGRIERRYNLRFSLAVAMENQTLPLGLGSLWAGSGAKYSWRGVCNCVTKVNNLYNRDKEIYWWVGLDGSRILMKWNSLFALPAFQPQYSQYYASYPPLYGGAHDPNENIGGYAEARYPFELVDFVDSDATFTSRYPYKVIGAFGQGWDELKTISNIFPIAARMKSNSTRRVIVSNEADFFQEFESLYGATLPAQSVTYGNEWELACATMQEVSATVRRALETLRSAEAMATLVSLKNPAFLPSRMAARDQAFVNLGLYWEHDFLGGGPVVSNDQRADFQRRVAANIVQYVDTLYRDAATALGGMIQSVPRATRFFVFNPLGWIRTDYADFAYSGPTPIKVVDVLGNTEVPSQIVTLNGASFVRILATNVPAVGYKVYEIRPGAGTTFTNAATVTGNVIENATYKITIDDDGAIVSLIDRRRGNREFVAQRTQPGRNQTVRVNDLGYNAGNNYRADFSLENVGPVSATLRVSVTGQDVPLDHVTRITLFRGSPRIAIQNNINENFDDVHTWGFGFNLTNPDVWYEEVGAILRARLVTEGGHYAVNNARYDWQSLGHFADMSGNGVGVTLSNADCHFMQVGNSTTDFLDTQTPILSPLAGGRVDDFLGIRNQNGDSHFLQRFALTTHGNYNPTSAMRFALEHQNPFTTGAVTGKSTAPYPARGYGLIAVSDNRTLLWALKPAEEGIDKGIIARLWNVSNIALTSHISLTPPVTGATRTTHIETDLVPVAVSGKTISPTFGARQMQTFRLLTPI